MNGLGGAAAFGCIGVVGPIILVTTARLLGLLVQPDQPAPDKREDVMACQMWLRRFSMVGLLALLLLATEAAPLQSQMAGFPARLDSFLQTSVKLTAEQRKQLLAGQP